MDYRPLLKILRPLEDEVLAILVAEGVPTALARRFSRRVVQFLAWRDPITWRVLGELLVAEIDQLYAVGLPSCDINAVLPRLSADQAEGLWKWLHSEDPEIARDIFGRAVQDADPVGSAARYLDNYRLARKELR